MQIRSDPLDPLGLLDRPDEARRIVLSEREREILRGASKIAGRAREMARQQVGEAAWELSDEDMALAHVEHDARDLAESGEVSLGILTKKV